MAFIILIFESDMHIWDLNIDCDGSDHSMMFLFSPSRYQRLLKSCRFQSLLRHAAPSSFSPSTQPFDLFATWAFYFCWFIDCSVASWLPFWPTSPSPRQHHLPRIPLEINKLLIFSFSFIFACLCLWISWPTYCGSGDRSLGKWSTR